MRTKRLAVVGTIILGWILAAAGPQAAGTTILSNDSYVRALLAFRTPVQASKDGRITTVLDPTVPKDRGPKPLAEFQSPLPPEDWIKPEFDDSPWDRQRSPVEVAPEWWGGHTSLHSATSNSIIYLRWKFAADDPAKTRDLALAMEYVGGLVVYFNGREVARRHLPPGGNQAGDTCREVPRRPLLRAGREIPAGNLAGQGSRQGSPPALRTPLPPHRRPRGARRAASQGRQRAGRRDPPRGDQRGGLAAERKQEGAMYTRPGIWAYAGLKSIRLQGDSGVVPNVSPPRGIQVWNVALCETITAFDYGDPQDALRPITVSTMKNGVFSGRLAVSSREAIHGLKVTVSPLHVRRGRWHAAHTGRASPLRRAGRAREVLDPFVSHERPGQRGSRGSSRLEDAASARGLPASRSRGRASPAARSPPSG